MTKEANIDQAYMKFGETIARTIGSSTRANNEMLEDLIALLVNKGVLTEADISGMLDKAEEEASEQGNPEDPKREMTLQLVENMRFRFWGEEKRPSESE